MPGRDTPDPPSSGEVPHHASHGHIDEGIGPQRRHEDQDEPDGVVGVARGVLDAEDAEGVCDLFRLTLMREASCIIRCYYSQSATARSWL